MHVPGDTEDNIPSVSQHFPYSACIRVAREVGISFEVVVARHVAAIERHMAKHDRRQTRRGKIGGQPFKILGFKLKSATAINMRVGLPKDQVITVYVDTFAQH